VCEGADIHTGDSYRLSGSDLILEREFKLHTNHDTIFTYCITYHLWNRNEVYKTINE